MFRKIITTLVAVAAIGSPSAFAYDRDGDGNSVPGLSVTAPASGWERAYAGPRQAYGIVAAQKSQADRLSQVH